MKRALFLMLAMVAIHSTAFASELPELFNKTFYTHYSAGRCGDNILGLLRRAETARANIYNANMLEITDLGGLLFGFLNAEWAREGGKKNPNYPNGLYYFAGEKNWYHHIVLEQDGMIYDFDFGNAPVILPVKDYFEKMFLNDKTIKEGGEFYVGREAKLKFYQILVRPAKESLQATRDRKPLPQGRKIMMGEYIKSF